MFTLPRYDWDMKAKLDHGRYEMFEDVLALWLLAYD